MSYFSSIKLISDFLKIKDQLQLEFDPTFHRVAQVFGKWPVAIYDNGITVKLFEWGLIAPYMNTAEKVKKMRSSMANARSEKMLHDKSSVWYRLRKQRCLVFCNGFFEHRDIGAKNKLPYFIKPANADLFCFAGLYNYSPLPDMETGEIKGTFAILTREANKLMAQIHNSGENSGRMPVILSETEANRWIMPALSEAEIDSILSHEYPSALLQAWPVNRIRTPKEDNENVITPVSSTEIPPLVM